MIHRLAGASRYLILIAVLGCFVGAVAMLVYGAAETLHLVVGLVSGGAAGPEPKKVALSFIKMADIFLIGTVLFIIAAGLYELFIDENIPIPAWLEIHSLDDLKNKLLGVVIVILSILFLEQIVAWDGQTELLSFGAAIALVIAALAYFLSQKPNKSG